MQRVRISVVRGRPYHPGDGFVVYGDRGSGTIDWDRPLSDRVHPLWPDRPASPGHLLGGHLAGPHLVGSGPDGHLWGTHLLDAHLEPALTVDWESERHVFGRFRFAVIVRDPAGNPRSRPALHEIVLNSAPPPAPALWPVAFDSDSGRLTLAFQPSWKLHG